jgi:hypothetical protein
MNPLNNKIIEAEVLQLLQEIVSCLENSHWEVETSLQNSEEIRPADFHVSFVPFTLTEDIMDIDPTNNIFSLSYPLFQIAERDQQLTIDEIETKPSFEAHRNPLQINDPFNRKSKRAHLIEIADREFLSTVC